MALDLHLVCGGTGAGKSTFSKGLAEKIGGIHFAIDNWMATLFWMDSPKPIEFNWTMERIDRCEKQIWSQVLANAHQGVPAILDLGFTKTKHRQKFADKAKQAGLTPRLYFIDVPSDIRWQRVEQRNKHKGETFALKVSREMFDFMENEWQAPNDKEMQNLGGVRITL